MTRVETIVAKAWPIHEEPMGPLVDGEACIALHHVPPNPLGGVAQFDQAGKRDEIGKREEKKVWALKSNPRRARRNGTARLMRPSETRS